MADNESTPALCSAEAAGYGGMFGVYCELTEGHSGPHNDGYVEWDFVDPRLRNSDEPPHQVPGVAA